MEGRFRLMNSYKIIYQKEAEKFIRKNKAIGIRFIKAFEEIASDMAANFSKYDIKKMQGYDGQHLFRLRIGKYRAIFKIEDDQLILVVFVIDSRGGIYK